MTFILCKSHPSHLLFAEHEPTKKTMSYKGKLCRAVLAQCIAYSSSMGYEWSSKSSSASSSWYTYAFRVCTFSSSASSSSSWKRRANRLFAFRWVLGRRKTRQESNEHPDCLRTIFWCRRLSFDAISAGYVCLTSLAFNCKSSFLPWLPMEDVGLLLIESIPHTVVEKVVQPFARSFEEQSAVHRLHARGHVCLVQRWELLIVEDCIESSLVTGRF